MIYDIVYVSKVTQVAHIISTKVVAITLWGLLLVATVYLAWNQELAFAMFWVGSYVFLAWLASLLFWAIFASNRGWEWRKGHRFSIEH